MNKEFLKAMLNRSLRTVAQTFIASVGTAAVLESVDWRYVISASLLAGLLSCANSIATGLPEVK